MVILYYVYNVRAFTRGSQSPEHSFTVNGFGPCSIHQMQMSWGNLYHPLGSIYCVDSISSYCFTASHDWLTFYWLHCEQPWLGMWLSPLLSILKVLFNSLVNLPLKLNTLVYLHTQRKISLHFTTGLVLEAEIHWKMLVLNPGNFPQKCPIT